MPDIQLRPYQRDFINNVRKLFADKVKRVVGVAPCGAGKTVMTAYMVKQSLNRNKRTIFFVHRRELIAQTAKTFNQFDIPFGIIDSQVPMQLDLPVQIASVQTLARRIDKIPAPDFLICDECHHILANTYKIILNAFPNAYLLGVTATPLRTGGVNLGTIFDDMVQSLSVNELIKLGNLTKFHYFEPPKSLDLSGIRTKFGEFNQSDLSDYMRKNAAITGDIVREYQTIAPNKSAICYCVDVEHSKSVAQAFNDAGIPAAHCDGETPATLRNKIVDDFRRGNIKILCNAELFGEGFDVPNMQAVILARPTKSLTLYIQQAMRPLRPDPNDPNKVAIIIDHVQNGHLHGLPNKKRDWTLTPDMPVGMLFCKKCKKIVKPVHRKNFPKKNLYCPFCGDFLSQTSDGNSNEYAPRKKSTADGKLNEIEVSFDDPKPAPAEQPAKTVKQKKPPVGSPEYFLLIKGQRKIGWVANQALIYAKTIDDIAHIAEVCGYKKGWVVNQARQFVKSLEDFIHVAEICGYKKGWAWHQWQDFHEKKSFVNVAKHPPAC